MRFAPVLAIILTATLNTVSAQSAADAPFAPTQQWNAALNSADGSALRNLYSTNPPAQFIGSDKKPQPIDAELSFWQELRAAGAHGMETILRESGDENGLHVVLATVKFQAKTPAGDRTRYVIEQQGWQKQSDGWRIVVVTHSDVAKMPQPPKLNPQLYPAKADAKAEIKEALARATREHKRVILIFGANWCLDCHILDYALHQTDAAPIAKRNFIMVHVDVGEYTRNLDLASQYQIPLKRGVPALAVLDANGKLLYSAQGEFEKARSMDPDDLIAFLNKWKPSAN